MFSVIEPPITEFGFDTDLVANITRPPYVLSEMLVYRSVVVNARIVIPSGFTTDLASIPRLVHVIIPKEGKYNAPAVVHDWLYQKGRLAMVGDGRPVSRKEADDVFYEAMRAMQVRRSQAWAIYRGVRAGGWVAWGKYRRGEKPDGLSRRLDW